MQVAWFPPSSECYTVSKWCKFDVDKSKYNQHAKLHGDGFKQAVATYYDSQSTRIKISDNNTKNNRDNFSYRYGFNLQSVKYLLLALNIFSTPIYANEVGGVSATANPVANSSGFSIQFSRPKFIGTLYN